MVSFDTCSTIDYSLADLAALFTRSFEGYFIPVHMTTPVLAAMLRRDGVDLTCSRVLLAGGAPAGVALIARRGWTSRLAAMGVATELRGQGAGAYLLETLLAEARARGERGMALEVIDQNAGAIHLYEKFGFRRVRPLIGLARPALDAPEPGPAPTQVDLRALAARVSLHGFEDLPWQLAAETLATFAPPMQGVELDGAYAAISDPEAETISFWSLLVDPPARGQGRALALVRALLAAYPGKVWRAPAIYPEEIGRVFERAGFVREPLGQYQMATTW